MKNSFPKLIVITGPTATGKTRVAVKLAHLLNGEIISADSRQIYRGMDIGTGKDLDEYNGIPYHLIDILDPSENYSVYDFQIGFLSSYESIVKRGKLPILCGGTGYYIESILLGYELQDRPPPDENLRKKYMSKSKSFLLGKLKSKVNDNSIFETLLVDTKVQIIRQIEIFSAPKNFNNSGPIVNPMKDDSLIIGIDSGRDIVRDLIKKRLVDRVEDGMIEEVQSLLDGGLHIDRLDYFGLEYKYVGSYLKNDLSKEEMIQELTTAIRRFAKRQRTWFRGMEKKGMEIHWIDPSQDKNPEKTIQSMLKHE